MQVTNIHVLTEREGGGNTSATTKRLVNGLRINSKAKNTFWEEGMPPDFERDATCLSFQP